MLTIRQLKKRQQQAAMQTTMSVAPVGAIHRLVVIAALVSLSSTKCNADSNVDILGMLERDVQGKVSPFLAGRHGSFYMGGQSLAATNPLTSLWPVKENETLGFMHPYFRDARARGIAITCDEVTGCGHSLNDWEFYRDTRVLNGSVIVDDTRVYSNPAPTTLLWRPDRVTARYDIEPGVVLQEVKFFTNDDVLLDIITLLPAESDADGHATLPAVTLNFDGASYVNTKPIPNPDKDPSSRGLSPDTQRSIQRNATSEIDTHFADGGCGGGGSSCGAIHVAERGTAYAKPIDCNFGALPPGVDCLLKEGPLMYDGQSVFVAASAGIAATATAGSRDADRRATYAFSVPLSAGSGAASSSAASPRASPTPLVLGWVQGDDEAEARQRIRAYMSPSAAAAALAARTAAANEFLATKVPQLNVTLANKAARGDRSEATMPSATAFDEHLLASCRNTNANKYNFLHNATSLQACEAACSADDACLQVEFQHVSPQWCALYNVSTAPGRAAPGTKYDCACKGDCPSTPGPSPGPGPKPPQPSPVPPMNRTLDFNNAYYFGWAMYWMMLLESNRPPYETVGHAQSAANNFLGIHLHDTQYYLRMGSWVVPDLHPRYAHGNVLMWHRAAHSPQYSNISKGAYWPARSAKGLMPDNMGSSWIASSTCDQLHEIVEDSWTIYTRSSVGALNTTFLTLAYDLFDTVLRPTDGNITSPNQKQSWRSGKGFNALLTLSKMATALGKHEDAAAWLQLLANEAPFFRNQWGTCRSEMLGCNEGVNSFSDALVTEPYFNDTWARRQADAFLLNNVTGYFPPNASFGAVLLAKPLNTTSTKIGPWVAHTTYTYEAIEGLFRHNVGAAAIKLATGHIRDMQRTYGWTIFPEAWSLLGGPWGDQWYNWGSCVSTVMTLERLAGVSYSAFDRAPGATADGVFTVRDFLPDDWARADVRVPLGDGKWVVVAVERVSAKSKRITVSGNPFGALALQPSLGSKQLVKAEPAQHTVEDSGDRVDWLFVGTAAQAASVTVEWA